MFVVDKGKDMQLKTDNMNHEDGEEVACNQEPRSVYSLLFYLPFGIFASI